MTRAHRALAVLVCVVMPGLTWRDGSGWLAWTMFSKSETYRFEVTALDASGGRYVAPTALAAHMHGALRSMLAGAESWRHGPFGAALASQLPGIARVACSVSGAHAVSVTLERRRTLDAPIVRNTVERQCAR